VKNVIIGRLFAAVISEGANYEQLISFRRQSMERMLKDKDRLQLGLELFKEDLTKSELKHFPQHPVFMSSREKKQYLRSQLRVTRELFEEISYPPQWRESYEVFMKALHTIDEGTEKLTLKYLREKIFFGSKRIPRKPEKVSEFLMIMVKDNELRAYLDGFLRENEKYYEKSLENIRSWIEIVKMN